MKKVSVVIPIYNIPSWLELCIDCLMKSKQKDEIEIICVVNSDNPNTEKIINRYQIDNILRMDYNVGVPISFNEGALVANGQYLCFLHTDTLVTPNTIRELVGQIEKLKQTNENIIGICPITNYAMEKNLVLDIDFMNKYTESKLCNKSINSTSEIIKNMSAFYEKPEEEQASINYFYKFAESIREKNKGLYKVLIEISHYCLLIEKSAFFNLGMFDIDFYPIGYFEKLFYEKALKSGYEIYSCREIYVHHNGNTTSDSFGFSLPTILEENKELFEKKRTLSQQAEKEQFLAIREAMKNSQMKKFASKNINVNKKMKNALFIRHGGLGDIIMTLPYVNDFKNKFPDCKISYMSSPQYKQFINLFEKIDQHLDSKDVPTNENWLDLVYKNRSFSMFFDYICDWTYCAETDSRQKEIPRTDIFKSKYEYEIDEIKFPEINVTSSNLINNEVIPTIYDKLIVFNPCSSNHMRSLNTEIIQKICQLIEEKIEYKTKIVIIHNTELSDLIGDNIINLTGKTNLVDLVYLINIANAVISVDTCAFHLAGLLNKPCLGLFGAIPPKLRSKYYTNKMEIMYPQDLKCCPCFEIGYESKCDNVLCLNSIDLNEVIDKLNSLIK